MTKSATHLQLVHSLSGKVGVGILCKRHDQLLARVFLAVLDDQAQALWHRVQTRTMP